MSESLKTRRRKLRENNYKQEGYKKNRYTFFDFFLAFYIFFCPHSFSKMAGNTRIEDEDVQRLKIGCWEICMLVLLCKIAHPMYIPKSSLISFSSFVFAYLYPILFFFISDCLLPVIFFFIFLFFLSISFFLLSLSFS